MLTSLSYLKTSSPMCMVGMFFVLMSWFKC